MDEMRQQGPRVCVILRERKVMVRVDSIGVVGVIRKADPFDVKTAQAQSGLHGAAVDRHLCLAVTVQCGDDFPRRCRLVVLLRKQDRQADRQTRARARTRTHTHTQRERERERQTHTQR